MTLKARLENDLKTALKSKDTLTTAVLRLVLSALKNEELSKRAKLDDNAVISVLSTLVKQRRESITAFEQGGRIDLANKEKAEIEIINKYLPKQLSNEEIEGLVDEAVSETKAASVKDMGKVMKVLMPKIQGRADGKLVSEIVKKKLSP